MNQGKLFVLSGPSGVGKGTICKEILATGNFRFSVSMTTRAPREGEADGKDYLFVSKEEFEKCIEEGQMLEHAEAYGNYYGTPKEPILENMSRGINTLLDIEMVGALNVKKSFPEAVLIFLLPPDTETLVSRLRERGSETPETLKVRTGKFMDELEYLAKYDYYIINDDLKQAVNDSLYIIDRLSAGQEAQEFKVPEDTSPIKSRYKKGE